MGYYPLINHEHRFVAFWNAKAACTTIKRWFVRVTEGREVDSKKIHQYVGYYPRARHYVSKEELEEEYSDYYRFIVVRNPWERLVSCFVNKAVGNPNFNLDTEKKVLAGNATFREFVALLRALELNVIQHHLEPQSRDLEGVRLGQLVKVEDFDKDMQVVCETIGLSYEVQERFNVTPLDYSLKTAVCDVDPQALRGGLMPAHRFFYDEDLKKVVRDLYSKDIDLFQYEFPS